MSRCIQCQTESDVISSPLEVCVHCIREFYPQLKPHIDEVHGRVKQSYGLPPQPPSDVDGLICSLCANQCQIAEQGVGYCGTRYVNKGRLLGGGPDEGHFSCYYDPLPTNCVADWVCPGGTGSGYPQFSHARTEERGYKNLAVFFKTCTFNCLYCQNWHYREESLIKGEYGADAIADRVDERTSCVCYFGGDPTPQLRYALQASRRALEKKAGEILRICWETNGSMNEKLLDEAADISIGTGGCIKFDIKAWSEELHIALCGVSNRRTLSNFKRLASRVAQRPDPPFLVASTLLVPGYIDEEEVRSIGRFIAALNPEIPYSLLAFHPQFHMQDLPRTSLKHAQRCLKAAQNTGLKHVKIGNLHLLGNYYE
ncbi:MAG: radical SAM protein [Candidatus Aminicenantes bacterium]